MKSLGVTGGYEGQGQRYVRSYLLRREVNAETLSVVLVPMAATSPYNGPVQETEFPGTPRRTLALSLLPPPPFTQSSLSLIWADRWMPTCSLPFVQL